MVLCTLLTILGAIVTDLVIATGCCGEDGCCGIVDRKFNSLAVARLAAWFAAGFSISAVITGSMTGNS